VIRFYFNFAPIISLMEIVKLGTAKCRLLIDTQEYWRMNDELCI